MAFSRFTSEMTDPGLYGSKAATLSRVSRGGIKVPPGWVLDMPSVSQILADRGFAVSGRGMKIAEADRVYESLALPPRAQLYGELMRSAKDILKSTQGGRWAVRSSHLFEDGAGASFAGLFRTDLNVVHPGDLMRACLACIRHGFSAPLVAYLRSRNIEYLPPTALLLQPLVSCRTSGILARQGEEHDTIIHANWGLCYSVVNGLCAPDEWCRSSPGSIVEFTMGQKEVVVLPWMRSAFLADAQDVSCDSLPGRPRGKVVGRVHSGRLLVAEVPKELRDTPCMTGGEIETLLNLSGTIEDLTGLKELDIEWCILPSGEVCILQVRALTAEIMHGSKVCVEGGLRGLPLVQGRAEGKAYRVETETQAMRFPAGGILVTEELAGPSLRAMYKACACILPTRSILSHSAIIAREIRLPAVGSISPGLIREGRTYRVNGTEGSIHALSGGILGKPAVEQGHHPREDSRRRRIEFRPVQMVKNLSWDGNRVVLPFDSPIVWFRESYLRGITALPKMFFGRPCFTDCSILSDRVEIDTQEWTQFFLLLTRALRDDDASRRILASNMAGRLRDYRTTVRLAEERWRRAARLREAVLGAQQLEDDLTAFSNISSFSFLNFSVPVNWVRSVIASLGIDADGVSLDDFLVSKIIPHRTLLRRAKVEMALQKQRHGALSQARVDRFRTRAAPYEFFVEWCIDDSFLTNDRLLLREIDELADTASAADLEEEIRDIDTSRRRCLSRRRRSMAAIGRRAEKCHPKDNVGDLGGLLKFLCSITTQEEMRHMLQTRHLIVLGSLVRSFEVDAAEAGLDDILFAARARWGS